MEVIRQSLIGASEWTRAAVDAVATLAADDRPILIEGEPGAGKEFLARLIHRCSARSQGPFVSVPRRSVPMNAIRAFIMDVTRLTTARQARSRSTLLERAKGGMLFLDMTPVLPLLPPDEIETFTRREVFCEAGTRTVEEADVRVVIGLMPAAQPGPRRAPAPERPAALGLLPVWPLRERKDDIEPLTRHFIGELCRRARREANEVSAEALALLRRYDWPGNVAELRCVVAQMVHGSRPACLDSSLIPEHVAHGSSSSARSPSATGHELGGRVREFETTLICEALERCHGNMSAAARLLGVSSSTLYSKLKQYGLVARVIKI